MGDPSAIVKSVHMDDLIAYADIVTANVYSTEPCALTMIGKIDKMDEWNSITVTLVRKEIRKTDTSSPVIVASSVSSHVYGAMNFASTDEEIDCAVSSITKPWISPQHGSTGVPCFPSLLPGLLIPTLDPRR